MENTAHSSLEIKIQHIIHQNQDLFDSIFRELQFSEAELIAGFIKYNSEVETLNNDAYGEMGVRIAMFAEYLMEKSWHEKRQSTLWEYLKYCQPNRIIDIGFGAPTQYCKEWILTEAYQGTLTFADKYDSAFELAKAVLKFYNKNYTEKIDFKKVDLDVLEDVGKYDTYILQDAIEHSKIPEQYLENLVQKASENAYFLFSIPIAPPIPCHHIYWLKEVDALKCIRDRGLKIVKKNRVDVNPEVDEFAKDWAEGEIYDLMLLTQKV